MGKNRPVGGIVVNHQDPASAQRCRRSDISLDGISTGVNIAIDVIPGLEPKPAQPRTDRPRSGPKGKPSSYNKSYVAKPWDGAPRRETSHEAKPAAAAPRGWIGEKNHGKPSGHKPKRAARSW